MKNSHIQLANIIQKIIAMCEKYDDLSEAHKHLRAAHASVIREGAKPPKLDNISKEFTEKTMKAHKKWWDDMLKSTQPPT